MLKRADKADKPKPVKPEKVKPEKVKGDKAAGKQQFFWDKWLEKRKKAKANVRESSLPKKPMTKEEKLKLIAAGAIFFVIVPAVIILINVYNANHPPAPPPVTR